MKDLLLASILITFMYFISGFDKINNFTAVSAGFAGKLGLPLLISGVVIAAVIILEIVAPVIIVAHQAVDHNRWRESARLACIALAAFTALATALYHFPPTGNNYRPFLGNMLALGAFLVLKDRI
jgi:uncharacterized membrane protein YphA (DoxX/SURF4 family)